MAQNAFSLDQAQVVFPTEFEEGFKTSHPIGVLYFKVK